MRNLDPYRQAFATLLVAGALTGATGCAKFWSAEKSVTTTAQKKDEKPAPTPAKVVVDGPALALGQPEQSLQQRKVFIERFSMLVTEKRFAGAQAWVDKHPDIALEVLRDGLSQPVDEQVLTALAQYHDTHCGVALERGWYASMTGATQDDQAYREARSKVLQHVRNGQFAEASQIDLVMLARRTPQPMREIDSLQLCGITRMLANDAAGAVQAFEQTAQVAMAVSPHQGAHALLLYSESLRRAGNHDGANQAWADAVDVGSQLVARQKPICDPTFWERALYLAPVGKPWPESVRHQFAQACQNPHMPPAIRSLSPIVLCSLGERNTFMPTVTIAAAAGTWRLERGEGQAALLLLKRAESASQSAEVVAWCRLAEARALSSLGQTAPATAILMQLAANKDQSPVTLAAIAALGASKVRQGQTTQGITLLRKALVDHPHSDWPERASAEADLALALLIAGEEREGLQWLENARRGFEMRSDNEAIAQSLWNEARYAEQVKNKKRCEELESQYASMQF